MAKLGLDIGEDLQLLENKIKQAKFEYNQYFLGNRPREPVIVRGEVQKIIAYWSNLPIRNTANRFRFNNLCARFFTFRRQWDEIGRKIEEGTYEPHLKKAQMRDRTRGPAADDGRPAPTSSDDEVCQAYIEARQACGQAGVDRAKVAALLEKQRAALREKLGCQDVRFRVVVEAGKPKLKTTPVRA
jgi:hypothetical protein